MDGVIDWDFQPVAPARLAYYLTLQAAIDRRPQTIEQALVAAEQAADLLRRELYRMEQKP